MSSSKSESERYQRQLPVEGWNQEKLRSARVLIVGVGGLGGISSVYLAAAGVGHMRICDSDSVELSNLNRQILFATEDIGKSKVDLVAQRLSRLNPEIHVESVAEKLTQDNAHELAAGYDLMVDGLDNHPDRQIINRASIALHIPYVYGAVNEWMGQVSFFNPPKTACLACLIPELHHDSGPTPVFGALPGLIGSLQATLALRYLMTGENPLLNTLLIFHADTMEFERVTFERKPDCRICGKTIPPVQHRHYG